MSNIGKRRAYRRVFIKSGRLLHSFSDGYNKSAAANWVERSVRITGLYRSLSELMGHNESLDYMQNILVTKKLIFVQMDILEALLDVGCNTEFAKHWKWLMHGSFYDMVCHAACHTDEATIFESADYAGITYASFYESTERSSFDAGEPPVRGMRDSYNDKQHGGRSCYPVVNGRENEHGEWTGVMQTMQQRKGREHATT